MKECQHCKNCFTDDVETCPNDGMPTIHTIPGEPVLEGKYKLQSRVGQGGMGIVYKAKHAYLNTLHAIKVILPDLVGNDPQLVKRFRQEALAAAAIRHHNVVQVTDYGVIKDKMPFLVMEFVEGEDLHDFLEREKRMSPEDAFEMISAICKGIGAAHRQGIVHRDMKPLNIMIVKDKPSIAESVKILDFGLAKIKSGELLGSFIQAQTTGLMGSPYYMAPEQWADDDLDARSDIYSIGVMLYQMLAGDVPFKGTSIPSIMKKHLSDPPPTFAERGVEISPQIEKVVFHTLEKDREDRTPTVEALIEELGEAIGISSQSFKTSKIEKPASPLRVLTNPPQSRVYVNDKPIGETKPDGWLIVEGLQTGKHNLRVSREGFKDWKGEVVCDGTPKQIVAELKSVDSNEESFASIPKPSEDATVAFNQSQLNQSSIGNDTPQSISLTQGVAEPYQQTAKQHLQTEQGIVPDDSASRNTQNKSFISPILLAVIGISGLLLLTGIVGIGVYMVRFSETGSTNVNTKNNTNTETQKTPPKVVKNEMVKIPGGEFTMGRDDGQDLEKPEHKVQVKGFWMDKTEVTNTEYYEFVKKTGYPPPPYWSEGKPSSYYLKQPVRLVSYKDVQAFIKWRSDRDKLKYRLPTEQEWEYAARNGSKGNLYPWGDEFKKGCAFLDATNAGWRDVGSMSCGANQWGVQDLIGNVYEWTSSKPALYPGNPNKMKEPEGEYYMLRGGGSMNKSSGKLAITSTSRVEIEASTKDPGLGFRLVRSE